MSLVLDRNVSIPEHSQVYMYLDDWKGTRFDLQQPAFAAGIPHMLCICEFPGKALSSRARSRRTRRVQSSSRLCGALSSSPYRWLVKSRVRMAGEFGGEIVVMPVVVKEVKANERLTLAKCHSLRVVKARRSERREMAKAQNKR